MIVLVLPLLLAVTVKQAETPLRSGCGESEPVVSRLAAGTPVEIKFSVSDGSDCYRVTTSIDGREQVGYLSAAELSGLETYERQRRSAPSTVTTRDGEQLPKVTPYGPDALTQAGLAAYRADDIPRALDYWKESLTIRPDERLEAFYRKVSRESAADNSKDKLYGTRVALRYEGAALSPDAARSMVLALDEELNRVSSQLGCSAEERITAIVQSRDAYLKTTGAAEWSGGLYDGRIHVSINQDSGRDARSRHVFAHEIVHACLANIGSFPAWLHEGLAQKLSGDTLSEAARRELQESIRSGALPKLENIRQDWSRMNADHARLAYNLALAAVEAIIDQFAKFGLQNIVHNPRMLQQITPAVDKALGL